MTPPSKKAIRYFGDYVLFGQIAEGAMGEVWFARPGEAAASQSQITNRRSQIDDWLSDLQTAAALEPRRSLARSYAGKAFSDAGQSRLAQKEFHYAKQLDPNDPTPWLYSALELWEENRVNEAVRDLDRSITLNDSRAVYRSRLLLDQDNATRRASLAKIYQSAGLNKVALREASRAVSYDYANHSAHQFLAESFNTLRDPTRFNLRYETVWFNELLLANLLSPVGAGLLSQNISQQEYSRLFEANRLGLLTSTEYRSDGQFREIASQYGLLGRFSYTLDLDYQHNDGTARTTTSTASSGIRSSNTNSPTATPCSSSPSNRTTKAATTSSITTRRMPRANCASPSRRRPSSSAHCTASGRRVCTPPCSVAGCTATWKPATGRLCSISGPTIPHRASIGCAAGLPQFTGHRRVHRVDRGTEPVWQGERHVTIAGGRFQSGEFDVRNVIDGAPSLNSSNYYGPPIGTAIDEPFHRWTFMATRPSRSCPPCG